MRKSITLLTLMLVALMSFTASADLWLIGAISPDGWDPSKGVQFTAIDENNYTLDIDVTKTGNQYYSLTTKLAANSNDWDGIKAYRFGGSFEVKLDTETELTEGTDNSPYTNFAEAATYTITFNVSTKIIKVTKKEPIVVPPDPTFNGTIYIAKESIGNIWAWDNDGDYFDAWPGKAINTIEETATVNGVEYYSFTYSHNAANPGLIFNDGSAQTADLVPEDGMVYTYTGGNTVQVQNPDSITPVVPEEVDVYVLGEVNGNAWSPAVGVKMATEDHKVFTAQVTTTGEAGYFSFSTKLAEDPEDWNGIAPFRFGAVSEGDFVVTEELLNQPISLTYEGGQALKIPAGEWGLTVDLDSMKLIITGEVAPQPVDTVDVYVLGEVNGNAWSPAVGVKMATEDFKVFTAKVTTTGEAGYFSFSTKLAEADSLWDEIAPYRFGAVSEGDFVVTEELLNQPLSLTYEGGQAFKIPAGEWDLTVNLDSMKLIIAGEIAPQPVDTVDVYVLGEVNGNAWSPAVGVKMATEDFKVFTAKVTTTGEAGYFSFTTKLAEADSLWDEIAPYRFGAVSEGDFVVTEELLNQPLSLTYEGGQAFKIPAGEWDLTVNLDSMKLIIAGEIAPQPVDTATIYILGDVNGNVWAANVGVEMATEDAKHYTAKIVTTGEDNYFEFTTKLAEADSLWADIAEFRFGAKDSYDAFWITDDLLGDTLALAMGGPSFRLPAGEWDLALDYEAMELVVTGKAVVKPIDLFIIGEVNGNVWDPSNGVKMTTKDNENFTATVTTAGENEGGSFFAFTTKLAEADSLWDDIAAFRFGPADGEGDFWITEELVGDTLNLAANDRAFRLEAGTWQINVNLKDMIVVVTESDLLSGDIDGDGKVDVGDINAMINLMLNAGYTKNADIDGDDKVDVGDLNALVNILLNQ